MLSAFRRRLGALIGGFEGGMGQRRLRGFVASRAHVNTLIQAAGSDMTARARYLIRNSGYAANAVEAFAANAVGYGIKPKSKAKDPEIRAAIHRLWAQWVDEADSEWLTDFYGLQRRAVRELFIAGEVFVRIRPRWPEDGLVVPLQLQLIPSEMLPLTNRSLDNGNTLRHGIEFDKIGRRVAYHFLRRHPGDVTDPGLSGETVRVPAQEVIHVVDPVDAGQLRGVSRFAPAIVKLFLLDQYDDAELDRKKVAAMFAGFVRRPAPEYETGEQDDDGAGIMPLEPGQLQILGPGEDITFSTPADVGGQYEAFQYRTLLQISAALGIPYSVLTNDMVKANYSNTRAALLEFRRRIEAFQYSVLVYQFCRPIFARWIATAALSGAIELPNWRARRREYQSAEWLTPKWEWVDPLKDARAEIEQIQAGLKSRAQAVAERGMDVEELDAEIAQDRARERELGLDFGQAQPNAPIASETPGEEHA